MPSGLPPAGLDTIIQNHIFLYVVVMTAIPQDVVALNVSRETFAAVPIADFMFHVEHFLIFA